MREYLFSVCAFSLDLSVSASVALCSFFCSILRFIASSVFVVLHLVLRWFWLRKHLISVCAVSLVLSVSASVAL